MQQALYITRLSPECDRSQVFPEHQSEWTVEQVRKLLQMTGLAVDTYTMDYSTAISFLVNWVDKQVGTPLYALDDGASVIMQSNDQIDVVSNGLDVKLMAKPGAVLQPIRGTVTCTAVRNMFMKQDALQQLEDTATDLLKQVKTLRGTKAASTDERKRGSTRFFDV